ncbi:GNAT family N-acetyltransferase [Oleidesulfovibrio alaskensis]
MNIVAAAQEDYPEILAVWEASVRATHDFLTEDNIQFFKPLILKEYLPAVDLYCAKDETGRIHGFLGVAEQNIEMLFLAPESRGRGLGKLLVNFAVAELGSVRVDVNE